MTTSPTGAFSEPAASVGVRDGFAQGEEAVLDFLELRPPCEVSLPCYYCGKESTFLAQFEFPQGWWGVCMGCGDERLVRYTRTVEE